MYVKQCSSKFTFSFTCSLEVIFILFGKSFLVACENVASICFYVNQIVPRYSRLLLTRFLKSCIELSASLFKSLKRLFKWWPFFIFQKIWGIKTCIFWLNVFLWEILTWIFRSKRIPHWAVEFWMINCLHKIRII